MSSPFPLTLNFSQGSVQFPFTPAGAADLHHQLQTLVAQLKAIAVQVQQGEKPSRQGDFDYHYGDTVTINVFCNPNLYPSPFAAKVLVTVKGDSLRVTTELELPQLLEDLQTYQERVSA